MSHGMAFSPTGGLAPVLAFTRMAERELGGVRVGKGAERETRREWDRERGRETERQRERERKRKTAGEIERQGWKEKHIKRNKVKWK